MRQYEPFKAYQYSCEMTKFLRFIRYVIGYFMLFKAATHEVTPCHSLGPRNFTDAHHRPSSGL
jgi:hypothetical protein